MKLIKQGCHITEAFKSPIMFSTRLMLVSFTQKYTQVYMCVRVRVSEAKSGKVYWPKHLLRPV